MARLTGFDLMHYRCSIMFGCGDDQPARWFLATVRDYFVADAGSRDFGKHHLHFDDGDKLWLDLAREEQDGQLRWKCGEWPNEQNAKGRKARKRVASGKYGKKPVKAHAPHVDLTFEDTELLYDLATNEEGEGHPVAAPPGGLGTSKSAAAKSSSGAGSSAAGSSEAGSSAASGNAAGGKAAASNAASLRKLGLLLLNLNRPADALQALRYAAAHGDEAAVQALAPLTHRATHAHTTAEAEVEIAEDTSRPGSRQHWLDQECPHQQAKRQRTLELEPPPQDEHAAAAPTATETPVEGPGETGEGGGEGEAEEAAAEQAAEADATVAPPSKKRPRGRAPNGKRWDASQGAWVAADDAEEVAEVAAEVQATKATEAAGQGGEPQQRQRRLKSQVSQNPFGDVPPKKGKKGPYEGMEPMARCDAILQALKKRKTSEWFLEAVSADDAPDYAEYVKLPMDYGTIGEKLAAGGYATPDAFAADVRLVSANAVLYSPEATDDCHKAARANLIKFEKDFSDAELATDGGEAPKAAAAAAEDDEAAGVDVDGATAGAAAAAAGRVQEEQEEEQEEEHEVEQRTVAAPAPAKRAPRKQHDESEVAARRMQAALVSLERSRRPSTAPSRFAAGAAPPAQKARLMHEAATILHAGTGSATDAHSVEFMSQVRHIAGMGDAKELRKAKIA